MLYSNFETLFSAYILQYIRYFIEISINLTWNKEMYFRKCVSDVTVPWREVLSKDQRAQKSHHTSRVHAMS